MLVFRRCEIRAMLSLITLLLAMIVQAQAKEWRGIVPLHSTRADVERLLGPPSTDRSEFIFYEFDKERISFQLSRGPCNVEFSSWNVPRDTVISIRVTPKQLCWNELKLDRTKYEKKPDEELSYIFHYVDEKAGIRYEVDESGGLVVFIEYFPSTLEAKLKCPKSLARKTGTGVRPAIFAITGRPLRSRFRI
jgi:hypothetical protein